jgi:WD40 repeat protein
VLTASAGGDRQAWARHWELSEGVDVTMHFRRNDRVMGLAFSHDHKTLVSARYNGQVEEIDLGARKTVGRGFNAGIALHNLAISPDGRTLLTFENDARLWDRQTGRLLHALKVGAPVHRAVFSPDGRTVLTGNDAGVAQRWDTATGKETGPALTHEKPVLGVGFGDGGAVWTVARDDTLREWDSTGTVRRSWPTPAGVNAADFSPAGRVALHYGENSYAQLRDLTAGQVKGPLVSHPAPHWLRLRLTPDGRLGASAGGDRTGP